MKICSHGYVPEKSDNEQREKEFQLFVEHIDLFLNREQEILDCREYFFCPLSFAGCSWPYVSGDGPLCLGYFLLAWREGLLIERCPDCGGKALVTFFGGSPLSGRNGWSGICVTCRKKKSGTDSIHSPFSKQVTFICSLRINFPGSISEWKEYDGHIFSWGRRGLTPARKKRLISTQLVEPLGLGTVIEELQS